MKKIVTQLKNGGIKDVLVIGDIMLDEYIIGDVERISPEAPVPVVKEGHREWSLGGAANVAANCRHIGFNVTLIGVVGDSDSAGQKLCTLLHDHGILTEGIVKSRHRITTSKKRIMARNHQLVRIDNEETVSLRPPEYIEVKKQIDSFLKPGVIVLISDYAKGVIDPALLSYTIDRAHAQDCLVVVDPKGPNFNKYMGVDYIKPNLKEFNQMVTHLGIQASLSFIEKGRVLCELLKLKGLFVTLGEKGIQYISAQEEIYGPACSREVYDLTGAGDTVCAFLALGLANNLTIFDCLRLANRAAAVAVSHVKTYAVSLEELVDRESEPTEKIFNDWMALKIEIDWLRSENKKVVFTNGCFDIIHAGHVHLLKEAKKLGDILVVALNTDDSVKRLNKGPERPINTLTDRAAVIAALGVVDFVVSFDQDTPQALIDYVRPDVLVKGGDYSIQSIIGAKTVLSYGGSVHVLDLVPHKSTTRIVTKIRQHEGA
jgi:D-beta-D-heptose 7-phosphate kinase/D-beta-D-heptose 1-phosphate adenosyltransferase